MGTLGTKKFYKSFDSGSAKKNQILKNSGYVNVVLHSAYYKSKGNFWQSTFGGNDKIALTSTITYKSTDRVIEAKFIVDKRIVKANRDHFLGISRLVALKVPSTADGLELKVEFTAVKDDNFENGLELMNSEEFKKPLQLASIPVGQILSVTSVIKKIFTGVENPSILESTYAGIISNDQVTEPVEKERLTAGYIVMVANNNEDSSFLSQADESKFSVDGDGLKYENKIVRHTNLVFAVTFDPIKGVDEKSAWFKRYQSALNKLDDITVADDEDAGKRILKDARKLWIEGNAILFEDPTYIDKEKNKIKISYFQKINERYVDLTRETEGEFILNFAENKVDNIDFVPGINSLEEKKILDFTHKESKNYFDELGNLNMVFPT